MNFEPIINTKIENFKKSYGIEHLGDNDAFEFFVNNTVLKSHQPEAFSTNNDLMEKICVGGQNDMGIDGIAIKINGIFINSKKDIDGLITLHKKINIEFIFIQSKYKEKLDSSEFGKFVDGITDFLSDEHYEPHNEKLGFWLELKDYLLSNDIIIYWNTSPDVRIYYAIMGTWKGNEHIEAKTGRLLAEISQMRTFGETYIKYLDSNAIKTLCDEIDNQFSSVLNVIDSFDLTEVQDVDNSLIILCNAEEIVKMLITDDGIIRKSLFTDNVRDYQGNTTINEEIFETIQNTPEKFSLYNNGITIVCSTLIPGNRKVTVKSPQIVNGCQTCNVLYLAHKQGLSLSAVTVVAKVIATRVDNITNSIVKGTNRQNIVYDEAFEITREFHKNLEEFFNVMKPGDEERYYYERRSRQYIDNPKIKATQKANFRILIQSFVSIFMSCPHDSATHEAMLLNKYRNQIFINEQSFLPYYLSVVMCLRIDKAFRENLFDKRYITFKHQLLKLIAETVAGVTPDINHNKRIDEYCNKLTTVIYDNTAFNDSIKKAIEDFDMIRNKWIEFKGTKYRSAIKDNQEFTKFMLVTLRGGTPSSDETGSEGQQNLRGKVVAVKKDRRGFFYGFISRLPEDIFFHQENNPNLDYSSLYGKDVVYKTIANSKFGIEKAKIIYTV